MRRTKRSTEDILLNILDVAQQPCKLTHIVGKCNLNFHTARPYIKRLMDKNFLEVQDGTYRITEKGRSAADVLREALTLLRDDEDEH